VISKTLVTGSAAAQQIKCANWRSGDHEPVCDSHVAHRLGTSEGPNHASPAGPSLQAMQVTLDCCRLLTRVVCSR